MNEFNTIKEAAPNAAAVLFRTILSLVLQERAKIKAPDGSLSIATDLSLEPSIKKSLGDGHAKKISIVQRSGCSNVLSPVGRRIRSTMWLTSRVQMH